MLSAAGPLCYALASASGGSHALFRLAGEGVPQLVTRMAGGLPAPWRPWRGYWQQDGAQLPCEILWCPGPRSFTGEDLAELTVPGSAACCTVVAEWLRESGAVEAVGGYFARRALANGRLRLDQAEALLALVHSRDEGAARRAIHLLRGGLGNEVAELRARLLHLRALVEAGLDFMEEEDVRAYDPAWLQAEVSAIAGACQRWRRGAQQLSGAPLVVLAGPANAGKSALFNALSGERALVSPEAGTTRDWLEAPWPCGGRQLRLIDTAGWLDAEALHGRDLDGAAIERGRALVAAASLVLWCSAPDAPLPATLPPIAAPSLRLATKADLGAADSAADLICSAHSGQGLEALGQRVAAAIDADPGLPPRQAQLLAQASGRLNHCAEAGLIRRGADDLLAAELRQAADCLGELLGVQTSDEILGAIFSQFCIGK
ncbi:MAG: hypothetical protein EA402_13035 [Planctomycetota bacterium]|nr:MAG: hypothetical protein EA402_13035 [Planctomycetota bacterium]